MWLQAKLRRSRGRSNAKSAPMKKTNDIRWYEELDSTNNEALRKIDSLDNLSVVAAVYQTAGRGQRGNVWKSGKGENLTFSVILKFQLPDMETGSASGLFRPLPAADQFAISEAVTLALCSFLGKYGIDARIKWPNDIYVGNGKISGMLVENSLSGSYVRASVAGIGLNVNQSSFPADLPNPVSMTGITGLKYDIRRMLEDFAGDLCCKLSCLDDPDRTALRNRYERMMYRIGEETLFADISGREAFLPANSVMSGQEGGNPLFKGRILGISRTGLLRILLPDGCVREAGFKEIAYVIG